MPLEQAVWVSGLEHLHLSLGLKTFVGFPLEACWSLPLLPGRLSRWLMQHRAMPLSVLDACQGPPGLKVSKWDGVVGASRYKCRQLNAKAPLLDSISPEQGSPGEGRYREDGRGVEWKPQVQLGGTSCCLLKGGRFSGVPSDFFFPSKNRSNQQFNPALEGPDKVAMEQGSWKQLYHGAELVPRCSVTCHVHTRVWPSLPGTPSSS